MKNHGQIGLLLAMICMINACKVDEPILPGQPGYESTAPVVNTNVVTGTSGSGANVANSNLTGTWTAKTTTQQYYNQNNAVLSSTVLPSNLFTTITLNETGKTAVFQGSAVTAASDSYLLTTNGNNLYIQLTSDPFSRTANDKIQIVNLTATAMTWVAIDPQVSLIGGQTLRNGYQVTFTK
jgi:hypothetical protein